jgi:beta-galactosidase
MVGSSDKVEDFTAKGGWIILSGLNPEGLADYNRLVGFDHMIRPFRRERVTFGVKRHPLTSGLTIADVALYSGQRIFPWTQGNYVAGDTFSYVVDYEDVAPFAEFQKEDYEHPDWNRSNMVNGMVSADAWKYIVNTTAPKDGPVDFPLHMPKEVTIREMEWVGNTFYYPVTKVRLIADGDKDSAVSFQTKPNNEPQTFAVNPPFRGKNITLRLSEWNVLSDKQAVTGLDNIRLIVVRPPEFYEKVKPLLNVGGLMAYPKGTGGIILCNILFKDAEDVPENLKKKRNILATILRNIKAPFEGGRSIIAGASLRYETIDLSRQANQYRTERGWFGDRNFTFKDMPTGVQKLAGVPFSIYEFPTSPVPTVLMLGGKGIPNNPAREIRGIPVNRKADALFFLHTMRLDARMNNRDRKDKNTYETLRYIVTYADGKTENIPIRAEIDIDSYRQKQPKAIPGAQIAWTAPFGDTEYSAVAYSKQWNNPRPDAVIKSIDMVYGEKLRGVPVLIALTTASAE